MQLGIIPEVRLWSSHLARFWSYAIFFSSLLFFGYICLQYTMYIWVHNQWVVCKSKNSWEILFAKTTHWKPLCPTSFYSYAKEYLIRVGAFVSLNGIFPDFICWNFIHISKSRLNSNYFIELYLIILSRCNICLLWTPPPMYLLTNSYKSY